MSGAVEFLHWQVAAWWATWRGRYWIGAQVTCVICRHRTREVMRLPLATAAWICSPLCQRAYGDHLEDGAA